MEKVTPGLKIETPLVKKTAKAGGTEKHILGVIVGNGNRASGRQIMELLKKTTGQALSVSALYICLDRLKDKGFLEYTVEEGSAERGGRPQRFFTVNAAGERAMNEALLADAAVLRLLATKGAM